METIVGTGRKYHSFGSLALTLAKLQKSGRALPHSFPFSVIDIDAIVI
jgi:hypothetical protein